MTTHPCNASADMTATGSLTHFPGEFATLTKESSTDWELAIDLPLGVVASQLARIEEQLRRLSAVAALQIKERDSERRNGAVSVRIDDINQALDSIRTLMSDIESSLDTTRRSSDAVFSYVASRKPSPERDD